MRVAIIFFILLGGSQLSAVMTRWQEQRINLVEQLINNYQEIELENLQREYTPFEKMVWLYVQEKLTRVAARYPEDALQRMLGKYRKEYEPCRGQVWVGTSDEENPILSNESGEPIYIPSNELGEPIYKDGLVLPPGLAYRYGCWVVQDTQGQVYEYDLDVGFWVNLENEFYGPSAEEILSLLREAEKKDFE